MANGMNLNIDNRLSIGTIIQIIAVVGIIFGWYFTTRANSKAIDDLSKSVTAVSESLSNMQFQKVDQTYLNERLEQHAKNDEKLEIAIRELTKAVTDLKIEMAKKYK